ncbi:FRG domain-containing protein [Marinomonas sp. 2405UD66-6]|uniref:FRG domain-containing protein n=1 Tax=Marinomonas sp. 2405UD66-6 TaxID=3391834 RepID=UPI0039C8F2EE
MDTQVPIPHKGMPEEVRKLYVEAKSFFYQLPDLSQAMLYAALNKMLKILGARGKKSLNDTLIELQENKQIFMSPSLTKRFDYFLKFSDLGSVSNAEFSDIEGFNLINELIASTGHFNEEYKKQLLREFHKKFNGIISEAYKRPFTSQLYRGESKNYYETAMLQGIARAPFGSTDPNSGLFTKLGYQDEELLNAFKRKASELLGIPTSSKKNPEWWILAQHYGVPTRLLDWTTNPLVALYFAVEKRDTSLTITKPDWDDGKLFYLKDVYVFDSLGDFELQPIGMWEHKEHSDPEINLSGLNYYDDEIFFIRPEYLDTRYKNQSTVLMFPKDQYRDHKNTLSAESLSIPKEIKHELRAYLRSLGITSDFIYPSLDGAAEASKTELLDKFGPIIGVTG